MVRGSLFGPKFFFELVTNLGSLGPLKVIPIFKPHHQIPGLAQELLERGYRLFKPYIKISQLWDATLGPKTFSSKFQGQIWGPWDPLK